MNHDTYDNAYIAGILGSVRSIAVLGASPKADRPSFSVMSFLMRRGYRVFPVNPGQAGKEIAGAMTYARLAELPEPVDMVDVFRSSAAIPGVANEVLAMDPLPRVVWMQLRIRDDASAARLEESGIKVVMNRCPAIEIPRLEREIGWKGPSTGG
ncbi:CoA-binding protein [Chelativorans sp. AA-79]|uniref:CoA-binding protein n=1 Tax=Chelativorans sp. AA-79 TaxID=3028735 RepID=UPI0023F805ED|nr:CoA-binding protein [Chelativorans sp. AA-79]WEX11611.1 CoA-binding protein [Chelativorans sp. AA-79]